MPKKIGYKTLRLAPLLASVCLLTCASCTTAPAAPAKDAGSVLLTHAELQALQAQSARAAHLVQHCNAELSYQASPVSRYAPAPHYSAQGVVDNDVSQLLANDGWVAYRSALCYALTNDDRYARHAQTILNAWSDTLTSVEGSQGQAEINFDFPAYIMAASWVRSAAGWDDRNFRRLLTHIVAPLSNAGRSNNHGDWGVLLDASIAAYTHDAAHLERARSRWENLMQSQVAADGSLPQEICRSDTSNWCGDPHQGINGLSYTHYALLPATLAAKVFATQGMDVWHSAGGQNLALAYAKAASWTLHPEAFPYYDHNAGKLNGVRNAAYFALLQQHYPNPDAERVLADGKIGMNGFELLLLFP